MQLSLSFFVTYCEILAISILAGSTLSWKGYPVVVLYYNLVLRYSHIPQTKIEQICGMELYEGFLDKIDFHQTRIRLSSAALMQQGFNLENLVQYIGGTHTGAHRNLGQIQHKLSPSVEPKLLNWVVKIFEYSTQQVVKGKSTDKNFMEYYWCGNHSTLEKYAATSRI